MPQTPTAEPVDEELARPGRRLLHLDDGGRVLLERDHRKRAHAAASLLPGARRVIIGPVLIAVISDTHLPRGARRLPDECVARIAAADLLLHAGDLSTADVLRELEAIGPPVFAVHGNVDSAELRRLLPAQRVVDAAGVRIAMVHDAGPRAGRLGRMRSRFGERADALVFGHSHLPLHERGEDGFQIFNPGSPTERRRAPHHTMGMARVEGGALEFELVEL